MQIPCDSARSIGIALSIGLKYKGFYESEHNLTQKLLNDLDSSYDRINTLVEDLNAKPTEIVKTNWSTVWLFTTLTAIITTTIYLITTIKR